MLGVPQLERDNVSPSTNSHRDQNDLDIDQSILNGLEMDKSLRNGAKLFELDNGLASENGFSRDLQNLNDGDCDETYDSYLSQHRDNYFLSADGDLLAIE